MAKGKDTGADPKRRDFGQHVGSFDLATGDFYDVSGVPIAGPAAKKKKKERELAEQDRAWQEWYEGGMK